MSAIRYWRDTDLVIPDSWNSNNKGKKMAARRNKKGQFVKTSRKRKSAKRRSKRRHSKRRSSKGLKKVRHYKSKSGHRYTLTRTS